MSVCEFGERFVNAWCLMVMIVRMCVFMSDWDE